MGLYKRVFIRVLFVSIISLGYLTTTHAALEARSGGLVYDTDIDLTWVANPLAVSGDQFFKFADALDWAANLNFAGATDWRLPGTLPPGTVCAAIGCGDSEYGHLFFDELGGTSDGTTDISDDPDFALFSPDFQGGNGKPFYWTGVGTVSDDPLAGAGLFGFDGLGIAVLSQQDELNVWAVHDGDVGASNLVAEPEMLMLMGVGLAGLLRISRN